MTDERTTRDKILARKAALWNERQSFESVWRDLSKYYLPKTGRFLSSDRNRISKNDFSKINDSSPTKAVRVMAAGLMAGMTSPARPWFRLATPDPELMKFKPVQLWLDKVQVLMRAVFQRSNTYRALHHAYTELAVYGTAAVIILPDFDNVIHCYPLTAGEYAIGTNSKGQVDTLYRQFDMTVGALVREFGKENCSQSVRSAFDAGNVDQWITVLHAIEPRDAREKSLLATKKPWASIYMEVSASDDDGFLREGGFDYFPAICPRWDVLGCDSYGVSPGMEALGDNKQLQFNQKTKSKVLAYQADPPVQIPTHLKMSPYGLNLLPGGQNYYDQNSPGGGIRTAYEVNTRIDGILEDIRDVRDRINATFFVDLFLMLANDTRSNITATEISERHEEKMLMLGPVLERLQGEMLSPLIDMVFEQIATATSAGKPLLPPPPQELAGLELKVEFISTLAQAQKSVALGGITNLLQVAGAIGQFDPSAIQDKIDFEQIVDVYAELAGTNPTIIRDDGEVEQRKQARAAQEQKMQQMQQMASMAPAAQQMAGAVSDIASIPDQQRKDLAGAMQGLTGYG